LTVTIDPTTDLAILTVTFIQDDDTQATGTVVKHPLLVDLAEDTNRTYRIQANEDLMVVSCDGQFLTAFPTHEFAGEGFCSRGGYETGLTTDFPIWQDGFIWDANEPTASALMRLLRDRRARIIEDGGTGRVAISRFDNPSQDAGIYSDEVLRLETGEKLGSLVSLVEFTSTDQRVFSLDKWLARRGLKYKRVDSIIEGSQQSITREAKRHLDLARQDLEPAAIMLLQPDPGLGIEHRVTFEGQAYRVAGIGFNIALSTDDIQISAEFPLRKEIDSTDRSIIYHWWADYVPDSDPPGVPLQGKRYMVDASPTGAWAGHDCELAEWNGASWDFTDIYQEWVDLNDPPIVPKGEKTGVVAGWQYAYCRCVEDDAWYRIIDDSSWEICPVKEEPDAGASVEWKYDKGGLYG
jgi:hypothetical protein